MESVLDIKTVFYNADFNKHELNWLEISLSAVTGLYMKKGERGVL